MEGKWNILIVFLSVFVHIVNSTIICGAKFCHGDNAYCCTNDFEEEECCWQTFVYQYWWFWFIWFAVLMLVFGCSCNFWKRRQRMRRLAVMANSQYPTYGSVPRSSVVVNSSNTQRNSMVHSPPPNPYYPHVPPNMAIAPPGYAPSAGYRPPGYEPSAGYTPSALPSYADSEVAKQEKPPAYTA